MFLRLPKSSLGLFGRCSALLLLAAAIAGDAPGQSASIPEMELLSSITAAASGNDTGPAGMIPVMHGFNFALVTSSQHDSSSGWSSLLMPNLAYRFNQHFSIDAEAPIYTYINIYENAGKATKPVYRYVPEAGACGDTRLSLHLDALTRSLYYSGAVSMGMPSGNTKLGLGAGEVTYDFNNHFEKSFRMFTPELEIGVGDASSLVDQRIRKDYISVGPMAHFQTGVAVALPWNMSFEANAYEQLPLSKDLIYSTTGSGKKKKTTVTNVGPAEDNGFLTSLDIPLSPHVTMSGFYSRSLRNRDDVAGFSFTFLLRSPRRLALPF
jgi:hypothetical protein